MASVAAFEEVSRTVLSLAITKPALTKSSQNCRWAPTTTRPRSRGGPAVNALQVVDDYGKRYAGKTVHDALRNACGREPEKDVREDAPGDDGARRGGRLCYDTPGGQVPRHAARVDQEPQ